MQRRQIAGCVVCSTCGRRVHGYISTVTGEWRAWLHGFRSNFVQGYQMGRYCAGAEKLPRVLGR